MIIISIIAMALAFASLLSGEFLEAIFIAIFSVWCALCTLYTRLRDIYILLHKETSP